jgi:RHS repeat-associated protein
MPIKVLIADDHPILRYSLIALENSGQAVIVGETESSDFPLAIPYDAVGNRFFEQTNLGTTTYAYDDANRLASVNGVTYTWDNNGNLLDDGVYTYTYDHTNRLVAVSDQQSAVSYAYNGLGDRLSQTVGSTTTNYTLDLAAGLTQVLADGTNTYLYGLGRIGEQQPAGWQYHLGDALGSVRQLVDASGEIQLSERYEPYGEVLFSAGSATSSFGFTGEMVDTNGLIYLRARYYAPYLNQFIQPDPIVPDYSNPQNLNAYSYVRNNSLRGGPHEG